MRTLSEVVRIPRTVGLAPARPNYTVLSVGLSSEFKKAGSPSITDAFSRHILEFFQQAACSGLGSITCNGRSEEEVGR